MLYCVHKELNHVHISNYSIHLPHNNHIYGEIIIELPIDRFVYIDKHTDILKASFVLYHLDSLYGLSDLQPV